MPICTTFFMAVAFLTRIPTPHVHIANMSAAVAGALCWYPLIGMLLGLAVSLPSLVLPPVLGGLLYVLLLVWLSRGLHWDGLADLCDACGACGTVSPDDTEALHKRFGDVLKDSRLGAFGAMGLVLGICAEILLATQVLLAAYGTLPAQTSPSLLVALASPSTLLILMFAPMLGRSIPALMQKLVPPRANSTLAKLLGTGLGWRWIVAHLGLSFIIACFIMSPTHAILLAAAVGVMVWRLCLLAKQTGGMNGDFFGAAIVGGEILTLFASQIHLV